MSTHDRFKQFEQFVRDLDENNRVNGNFSNDGLISLFVNAKEAEKTISNFRKKDLREKIRKRADSRNEKGHLVLQGDEQSLALYDKSYTSIDQEKVKEAFKDRLETEGEDAVEWLFDKIKSFYVGKIKDEIPEAASKSEPVHEEGNYWSIT